MTTCAGANAAPRPMKMGTIASRFPYDAAARDAPQSASLRRSAILHYASRTSGYRRVVRLPLNSGHPEQLPGSTRCAKLGSCHDATSKLVERSVLLV